VKIKSKSKEATNEKHTSEANRAKAVPKCCSAFGVSAKEDCKKASSFGRMIVGVQHTDRFVGFILF
jgi:hypothetical protein